VTENTLKNKTWNSYVSQDSFAYSGKDYFSEVEALGVSVKTWDPPKDLPVMNPVHVSDIFRWYILYSEGGVYADMDILFAKPIDELYEKIKDIDTVMCMHSHASIGLMASSPDNPFFQSVYETSKKAYTPKDYQCAGVVSVYKVTDGVQSQDAIDVIQKKWKDKSIYNLPFNVVYPFYYKVLDQVYDRVSEVPDESIGIHWYGGNPKSQKFNNILSHENINDHDNTFTKFAKICI